MLKGSLPNANLHSSSVMDVQSLQNIKSLGKSDSSEAVKAVAQQFESYFVHQMLKTMRASVDVLSEGNYLRSNATDFHQSMLDQQWAQSISDGQGMGLAEVLAKQLQNQYQEHLSAPVDKQADTAVQAVDTQKMLEARRLSFSAQKPTVDALDINSSLDVDSNKAIVGVVSAAEPKHFEAPADFVDFLMPLAEKAAKKLNTQPDVLLAQAALETGWGKRVIQNAQGSSHNLFNIKADQRWQGEKIAVTTLEFNGPSAVKVTAPFRAYDSWAQSFDDYVNFLTTEPRYQTALQYSHEPERFVQALQEAGYATDPEYAHKIERVRQRPELQQATLAVGFTKSNDSALGD